MVWKLYKFELSTFPRACLLFPGKSLLKKITSLNIKPAQDLIENETISKDRKDFFEQLLKVSKSILINEPPPAAIKASPTLINFKAKQEIASPILGLIPLRLSRYRPTACRSYFYNYGEALMGRYPVCESLFASNFKTADLFYESMLLREVYYYGKQTHPDYEDGLNESMSDFGQEWSYKDSEDDDDLMNLDMELLKDFNINLDFIKDWYRNVASALKFLLQTVTGLMKK